MADRLQVEVLTLTGALWRQPVDAVIAPLADGWIGVLPGHAPFLARLMRGQVVLRDGDVEHRLSTIGGSLSVEDDLVTLLTGAAALDTSYRDLEQSLGVESQRIRALEQEAEKHFDRVYRTLADTLRPNRRRIR